MTLGRWALGSDCLYSLSAKLWEAFAIQRPPFSSDPTAEQSQRFGSPRPETTRSSRCCTLTRWLLGRVLFPTAGTRYAYLCLNVLEFCVNGRVLQVLQGIAGYCREVQGVAVLQGAAGCRCRCRCRRRGCCCWWRVLQSRVHTQGCGCEFSFAVTIKLRVNQNTTWECVKTLDRVVRPFGFPFKPT